MPAVSVKQNVFKMLGFLYMAYTYRFPYSLLGDSANKGKSLSASNELDSILCWKAQQQDKLGLRQQVSQAHCYKQDEAVSVRIVVKYITYSTQVRQIPNIRREQNPIL